MNGIIIVNKEKHYTSRDVVNIISKILKTKKVGHTGTLDPIAEGVLVICVGKATKLCDYLTSSYKEYIAEFDLGYLTDTLDNTGIKLKTSNKVVLEEEIYHVVKSFCGEYEQVVPKYSAVKVNGKKLYEYARSNEDIVLPSRKVDIKIIDIVHVRNNTVKIKCTVSKGTYIRSLIRDIGDKLGTYATMTSLVRTKQGEFDISNSNTLEEIKSGHYKLISLEELFSKYYKIDLDDVLYKKISNGMEYNIRVDDDYITFYYNNLLVAIYKKEKTNIFKPFIMIN